MVKDNNINEFLRGCLDHRDQLFCLFDLKKPPWPYGWSLGWKRFFRWAVWLGEDRKCSAAAVDLDLLLGLSAVYIKSVF